MLFFIYSQLVDYEICPSLSKISIPSNKYGFDALLLASSNYHRDFSGVLDEKRSGLILCVPVFRYEFSGCESVDEFREIGIRRIPIDNWGRNPIPKVKIRFNNPRTRAGTIGQRYVVSSDSYLMLEVNSINGVHDGFVEVKNYLGETIKITSSSRNIFHLSSSALTEDVNELKLNEKIHDFLTK